LFDLKGTVMQNGEGLYVQYGCGFSVGEGWINYDNSPTLRLNRTPLLSSLARIAGAVQFPAKVVYGDVRNGPLTPTNTCVGLYASHVLEHLSLEDFRIALRNSYMMLKPGGIFRLIVPDLKERAQRYIELFNNGSTEANNFFLESTHLGVKSRPRGTSGILRSLFGNSAHLWMWDEKSMARELKHAGFTSIRRCMFNDSTDNMFQKVEHPDRFHDAMHDIRELAMECKK
jgi:hypothetical protein